MVALVAGLRPIARCPPLPSTAPHCAGRALPFIGILLTIATGPLLFPRVWHHHYGKLAFVWSALTLAPLAALHGAPVALAAFVHAMLAEYLSFIMLLFALYVVAGGILVTGNLRGTLLVNTAILTLGTLSASVVGTTGAAMILIRPLIRANADRLNNVHVVVLHHPGGQCRRRALAARDPAVRRFLRGVDFFWMRSSLSDRAHRRHPARGLRRSMWFYRKDRMITTVGETSRQSSRARQSTWR